MSEQPKPTAAEQPQRGMKICEHCKQQIIYYVDECQVPKPCGYVSLHSHCWQELGGPAVWNKPQPPSGKDLHDKAIELQNHAWLSRFRKANYENNYNKMSPYCCNQIAGYVDQFIVDVLKAFPAVPQEAANWKQRAETAEAEIERLNQLNKALHDDDIYAVTQQLTDAHKRLAKVREKLKEIVVTEGCDAGVVLLSDDGPTHYDAELKCQVYDHAYFSPLGDALVELAALAEGEG